MQTSSHKSLATDDHLPALPALPPPDAASAAGADVAKTRRIDSPETARRPDPNQAPAPSAAPAPAASQDSASGSSQPSSDPDRSAAEQPSAPAPIPFYKRPLRVAALLVVGVLLIGGGIAYWLHARHFEDTDDAFIDGHAAQMAAKVAGYVAKLHVRDNQLVHAGDLLLEIDARDFQVALDQAQAAEATAQGKLAQAGAQVTAAEAQLLGAKADALAAKAMADNADIDLARNKKLAPRGAVSQQSLDSSTAMAQSNAAQLASATAKTALAESQIRLAQLQQATAAAELQESRVKIRAAELNLSYARVVAPITGRVTHRTVEQGDYLTVGQPLFALVEPNVWVIANFKETQLTHMRAHQPVEVSVDAYPDRPLMAHVDSFQHGSGAKFSLLPAENATGNYVKVVQRVPVKIVFDEPPPDDMILGLGMSVEPRVTVR